MFDLIREIYQTLRNNKLRTFLTGFAVAWGIFMLIILLGMARGVVNGFENSRGSKGTNNVNVFNGRTSKAYAGYKEGRYIQLKNSDTQTVKDDVKNHVDVATAFVQGSNSVISTQHDYISASYSGVYPNFLSLRGEEIQEGRFINDMDMQLQRKVLVITRKNARILFEDSTKVVGGEVTMHGLTFTIIGVYDPEWGEDVFIPYSTARNLAGGSDNVDRLTLTIKNVKTLEDGKAVEQ